MNNQPEQNDTQKQLFDINQNMFQALTQWQEAMNELNELEAELENCKNDLLSFQPKQSDPDGDQKE
jgi:chromosome segregation ATPase